MGGGEHAEDAAWTFRGRRRGLCPGQVEASSPGEARGRYWRRLSEIVFNLCQSRREEDNSQTGSKLECGGEEKPWVCV